MDEQELGLVPEEAPGEAPENPRGHGPQRTTGQDHHRGRCAKEGVLAEGHQRLLLQ